MGVIESGKHAHFYHKSFVLKKKKRVNLGKVTSFSI